ncbi:MAG: dethiobiotin synthase [Planctomycetales bacterium]|nr:dethiobiotin synthase [Planctomycetales bacterium]
MKTLFVTGTGTEVGKTYLAALIAQQLHAQGRRVGVYKPVASGCPGGRSEDAERLWNAAGRPLTLDQVCPLRFTAPLAPHLAARAENTTYTPEQLIAGVEPWRSACDVLLVEGAGGLMSPLADGDFYNADLADALGGALVVVAANRLGVIHDTLATLLAASCHCRNSRVAGVILNSLSPESDQSVATNSKELRARCGVPLLAEVGWQAGAVPVDWVDPL